MVQTRIDVDGSDAIQKLGRIEEKMPEVIDSAVSEASSEAESNARDQLTRQGSVATGTGIDSLQSTIINSRQSRIVYGVQGRTYLKAVDEGTAPHTPEQNRRLRVWAEQNGFTLREITEHIEEEGTNPRPEGASWREIALHPAGRKLPAKVASKARRNIL